MKPVQIEGKAAPVVERKIGSPPRLWDRRAVFVANLLSLFFGNVRGTDVLRSEVGSLETYGGRLVSIIDLIFQGGENLLVLEKEPDPVLIEYFVEGLGLSVPAVEVAPHSHYLSVADGGRLLSAEAKRLVEVVRDHPGEWLDGFVTDEPLVRLARLTGKKLITSREGSHNGNNKYLLHKFLEARGLPVFQTVMARNDAEVRAAIPGLAAKGYRQGVVKAQVGASGIGMFRLNFADPEPVPDYLFYEGACLVQGWLEETKEVGFLGSPSVQMFIGDDRVCLFDLTDQILSRHAIHEGNTAPPGYLAAHPGVKEELLKQGEVAALWLHEQGYRGTASTDFHVVTRDGRCEVRLCEVNARITGATYPSLLARYFRPDGAWLMRNVRFTRHYDSRLLSKALDEAGLLFRKGEGSGVVPINFNVARGGYVAKGQFLAIGGDPAEVRELFKAIHKLESILWEYDRD